MATTEELQAQADEIRAILQRGAKSVFIDGQKVEYDFDELRNQLSQIDGQLTPTKKRRARQIDLSNF